MVELIDRDQPVVECLHAVGIDREAERRVGADKHLVVTFKECAERLYLAAVIVARGVAEVPLRLDMPVGPEAETGQRLIVEARPDGLLRDDDDGLFQALVRQLVERDEHQRAALARRGRRLDQKVLLTAFLVGPFLHRPHPRALAFADAPLRA